MTNKQEKLYVIKEEELNDLIFNLVVRDEEKNILFDEEECGDFLLEKLKSKAVVVDYVWEGEIGQFIENMDAWKRGNGFDTFVGNLWSMAQGKKVRIAISLLTNKEVKK